MKLSGRARSKVVETDEAGAAANGAEWRGIGCFFSKMETAEVPACKGFGRLFARKKRSGDQGVDIMKSVDEDDYDDERNDKPLFWGKSKVEPPAESGKKTISSAPPAMLPIKRKDTDEQSRDGSPRSPRPPLFRRRSKDRVTGEDGGTVEDEPQDVAGVLREIAIATTTVSGPRNNNAVVRAKLFPKKTERKQIKVVYSSFGPNAADVVTVERDGDVPALANANHVLIKVQASTVTLNDCLLRRGFDFNILSPLSLPCTPGYDIVGQILEVGSNVTEFASGERVAALVRSGGNARFLSVPASSLVKVPANLDSAEIAALVSIYTTAYQALRKISGGGPMFSLEGKKILILGGMDGVGQALIQLCKKAKATIYATAPTARHIYMKSVLGVNPLSETDGLSTVEGQLDYVFDGVCEGGIEKSFKALKPDGELVCYGQASMLKEREIGLLGAPFSARVNQFYTKLSPRVHTVDIWESFRYNPALYKQDLKSLCQLLKWNKLKPHIAKRVSLPEVAAAQARLETGDLRGTIVCLPWRPFLRTENTVEPQEG